MSNQRIANFFYIGTPRAGSTWLYDALKHHPEVYAPNHHKEPHFFSYNYKKGWEWYVSLYEGMGEQKIITDMSTHYYISKEALARIKEYNPEARVMFTVRNQAELLLSLFIFYGNLYTDEKFKAFLAGDKKVINTPYESDVKKLGFYDKYIESIFDAGFKKEQVLICFYDDFKENNLKFYKKICEFLDIDKNITPPNCNIKKKYYYIS